MTPRCRSPPPKAVFEEAAVRPCSEVPETLPEQQTHLQASGSVQEGVQLAGGCSLGNGLTPGSSRHVRPGLPSPSPPLPGLEHKPGLMCI